MKLGWDELNKFDYIIDRTQLIFSAWPQVDYPIPYFFWWQKNSSDTWQKIRDSVANRLTPCIYYLPNQMHMQVKPPEEYAYNISWSNIVYVGFKCHSINHHYSIWALVWTAWTQEKLRLFLCLPYSDGAIHRSSYHAVFLWVITYTCYLMKKALVRYISLSYPSKRS